MIKRMLIMLMLAGLVFGGIFGFEAFKAKKIKEFLSHQGMPAQTVSTTKAAYETWQPKFEAVGTLRAVRGVDIAPEVSGIVSRIYFKSGDAVKAGAPLIDLNADAEKAKLKSLEAAAALAAITYRRDEEQIKAKTIAQATIDADAANLKSANAQVAEQQATIEKKAIKAPFAGRLGLRQVDPGEYLNAGTNIVTLQSLDPIYVDFYVPQRSLREVRIGEAVTARSDAFPGTRFSGQVSAIDAKIDPSTRNVQVRASLHNPDQKLLPGMFVTVDIDSGGPQRYITLPQTAITYNPYGNTVFLVHEEGTGPNGKPKLVAEQKFVTTGATRGDQIAVLSGVKAGDVVVTTGQMKLRNGVPLAINNSIQPTNNPAPKPKDE